LKEVEESDASDRFPDFGLAMRSDVQIV